VFFNRFSPTQYYQMVMKRMLLPSVADPGSGVFLTTRPGSQIPNPYFLELSDTFLGKKFFNSLKIGPNVFLQHFKNEIIINFVKFLATKKGMTTHFLHPSLLLRFLFPKSGIRDG
jgi:hypothetical protein